MATAKVKAKPGRRRTKVVDFERTTVSPPSPKTPRGAATSAKSNGSPSSAMTKPLSAPARSRAAKMTSPGQRRRLMREVLRNVAEDCDLSIRELRRQGGRDPDIPAAIREETELVVALYLTEVKSQPSLASAWDWERIMEFIEWLVSLLMRLFF